MTDILLMDLGAVPDCHCDAGFEGMYKAMAESPSGDERSIWAPHENPFLTAHVEDVTRRLQAVLERIQDVIARMLLGEPIGRLAKADVPWMRWEPEQFEAVRLMLESKLPELYTLDDWMLVADYLIQRYLPDGVIQNEAEYLTVRASIMGKIQANVGRQLPAPDVMQAWATLTPTLFAAVPPRLLSPVELQVMQVAKTRAALHIGKVTETVRGRMKEIIIQHVQAQILGQKEGQATALKTALFDAFGALNRDFRRIAVTEAGEACNQGFIAACAPGTRVQRVEAYRGACKFCQSINGKSYLVCDPADPARDGATMIWLGKSNAGRSASPNRKVGGMLMPRGEHECWWCAAGVQHPHCRGCWILLPGARPGTSPAFAAYLAGLLTVHRTTLAANDPRPG